MCNFIIGSCNGNWCTTGAPTPVTLSPTGEPTESPSDSPTNSPTIQPTQCTDDPNEQFFFKMKDGSPLFKTCGWLAGKPADNINRICSNKVDSYNGIGPAKDICQATCGTCPTAAPTQTPTSAPTKSPTGEPTDSPSHSPTKSPTESPTVQPTQCTDDVNDQFFFRMKDGSPLFKTCGWLAGKTADSINRICTTKTDSYNGIGPAKDICKAICGNCPTVAPTKTPTKSPTKAPTTSAPTKSPTKAPVDGPTCCSQFFNVCKDNPWCQESEENCTTCNGVFLPNLPLQCIPRFGMCTGNEDACCYPSKCVYGETGTAGQCMYSP